MKALLKGTIFSIGCLMAVQSSAQATTRGLKCGLTDSIDAQSRYHWVVTNQKLAPNVGINAVVPANAKVDIVYHSPQLQATGADHVVLTQPLGIGQDVSLSVSLPVAKTLPKVTSCTASATW